MIFSFPDKLEEIREQERKLDTFTPIPSPYYMELTKLLLNQWVLDHHQYVQIKDLMQSESDFCGFLIFFVCLFAWLHNF